MKNKKDWREDYAEVEVWVHANFRHKLVVKIPENSTAKEEALRALKSKPVDYWCDKYAEDWINLPDCLDEDDRFEIGQELDVLAAFCDQTTEADVKSCCCNVEDESRTK